MTDLLSILLFEMSKHSQMFHLCSFLFHTQKHIIMNCEHPGFGTAEYFMRVCVCVCVHGEQILVLCLAAAITEQISQSALIRIRAQIVRSEILIISENKLISFDFSLLKRTRCQEFRESTTLYWTVYLCAYCYLKSMFMHVYMFIQVLIAMHLQAVESNCDVREI